MESDLLRSWLVAVVELAHDGWTVVPTPSPLARGQDALVACIPRATEAYMATPPLPDDPGVLAGPAHDLPGADADAVVLTVAIPVVVRDRPTRSGLES